MAKNEYHTHIQSKDAAKVEAKSNEKVAKQQLKHAKKAEKREEIREKKKNGEGVYKKLGPFTIKTWITIAIIIAFGIYVLVEKIQGR
jgi:hypothetical protein